MHGGDALDVPGVEAVKGFVEIVNALAADFRERVFDALAQGLVFGKEALLDARFSRHERTAEEQFRGGFRVDAPVIDLPFHDLQPVQQHPLPDEDAP